ncbi:MAG TPA: PDGLE domain-containing protein [Methanosarcina vacuolata]|uniref:Additional substrate-specific component NikN of nickel ECF transporter n=1 Tax=Methanosarcina vacuolata Z-761 TaxID=1434123 RepID=A0A0E3Q8C7_9EURY|nr:MULTISPECIES: PDGLE domain-containing protein [Methanosarcina]AKB45155.1 Additional substrate-specific component NikN of nickel ECF transporter [Methanosarcina vacuolata Z-761]AKB48634.1 Additional substrate-specific component NikN of nickel ECF transporter [Methanosarcina sp. Kolksee]HPS88756.1 PDGLE domain-containing protein [Methanosarcina vacuolata]
MSGKANMKLFYAGIVIALLLAVLAPFLASSDPDGLESAAGGVVEESKMSQIEETEPAVSSPMSDYSIEGLGKSGEVVAIAVGTLAVLVISLGLGKVFSKKV